MTQVVEEQHRKSNTPSSIWYAAYGSNLLKDRFTCYLEGRSFKKTPNARIPKRCDAGTEIHGDKPFQLGFNLYFAGESRNWGGGGVAFLGIREAIPPPTLGRAYLLTIPQLACVARGENGGLPIDMTNEILSGEGVVIISERGSYRVLVHCGSLNGIPVVTLTGRPEEVGLRNLPSETYLETIREGLQETYPDMTGSAIEEYLRGRLENDKV